MPDWFAELEGDEQDLEWLSEVLSGPHYCVALEGERYVLRAPEFSDLGDEARAHDLAEVIVARLEGLARLGALGWRGIKVRAAVRVDDDGTRHSAVFLQGTCLGLSMAQATLTVIRDGEEVPAPPRAPRQSEQVQEWLRLASVDADVDLAASLLAKGGANWLDLYKLWELVGEKQRVTRAKWATTKQCNRFSQTANYYRHVKETLPQDPMSLAEAGAFIRTLLHAWLRGKAQAL